MSNIPGDVHVCKGCGGWQRRKNGRSPLGWYSISVAVPPEMGKNGSPFVWAGMWCSAACLAGSMDELRHQEELARMLYDADAPLSGRWPTRTG